jgi:hypothetical protein
MHLARMEMRVLLNAVLDRLPGLRLGKLRAADLVHADHHEIGIELGLRAKHDGGLRYDAKVFRAGAAEGAIQPSCHDLMDRCRPGLTTSAPFSSSYRRPSSASDQARRR